MTGASVEVRRPEASELDLVRALVDAVVREVYPELADHATGGEDWSAGWVAVLDGDVVGVALTDRDVLDDLWLRPGARRLGVGSVLLAHAEREIADRGYRMARLRVVATNHDARTFYERRGWVAGTRFPHERLACEMLAMTKQLG